MNRRSTTKNGDRRFTLPSTLTLCQQITMESTRHLGSKSFYSNYDLDPCADRSSSCGDFKYTENQNGLIRDWYGHVFVNPPWSGIAPWVEKAVMSAWESLDPEGLFTGVRSVTMLIPDNRQSTSWWQDYIEPWRDSKPTGRVSLRLTTHYLSGRPRYGSPEDPRGLKAKSPPFGACVLVWTVA